MTVAEERLAARAMEAGAYEEAMRLLKPLVELNSAYALLTLGWIYETGATGTCDKDAARLLYERAAEQGSASASLSLGWLLLESGEEKHARAAFEAGARLGNDECVSALDRLNDNGFEQLAGQAIRNGAYGEALRLLLPLAERNSEYALLTLGWIYETGATGAPDKNAARAYYKRAAEQGSASAWHDLGRLLLAEGEEVQARAAFEAGAKRGDMPCMSDLGILMVEGRGGPVDLDAGTTWLEKAAAQGNIFAQRALLGLEERNAKTIFEKLTIKMKIASLVKRGTEEMLKDPQSDKLR